MENTEPCPCKSGKNFGDCCGPVIAGTVKAETAETVRIQYGGSMKPGNAAELLAKKDIDGGLIGGAALKAADFAGIVAAANV